MTESAPKTDNGNTAKNQTSTANEFENTSIATSIFPLSPDPDIASRNPENKTLDVYFDELDSVFSNDRIHNIAITGSFGIGKSSIISSYDKRIHTEDKNSFFHKLKKKCFNKEKHFLYVSLGLFNDSMVFTASNTIEEQPPAEEQRPGFGGQNCADHAEKQKATQNESQKVDINEIEKRLLLQIYSRFNEHRIPGSLFTLIQENHNLKNRLLSSVLGIWAFIGIVLLYFSNLGNIVFGIKDTDWIKNISILNTQLDIIIKYKSGIHLVLFIIFISLSAVFAGVVSYWLLTRGKIGSITLKGNNAEMQLEKRNSESYLDKYCYDIVYCIECIRDDIDNAIIFEDFDRLPVSICIELFTRLREINSLINTHIHNRKPVRFLYVIDDLIIGEMKAEKFFDYILPIIPILNKKTAEKVLSDNLETTNNWLAKKYTINSAIFDEVKSDASIRNIAHYIVDFRTQYKILNEYRTLFGLYAANNANNVDKDVVLKIFAFAVYHTYWPLDYSGLIKYGSSRILPICNLSDKEIHKYNNPELLNLLVNKSENLLTFNNLYFIGYTKEDIIQLIINNLTAASHESAAKTISYINAGDDEAIRAMHAYCEKIHCSEKDISTDSVYPVIFEAIKCDVRCISNDLEWFFKDRLIEECLRILCEIKDIELKNNFMKLSKERSNVYKDCIGIDSLHKITNFSEFMLIELCRGMQEFPQDSFSIDINGNSILIDGKKDNFALNETNDLIKQLRKRIKEGSI